MQLWPNIYMSQSHVPKSLFQHDENICSENAGWRYNYKIIYSSLGNDSPASGGIAATKVKVEQFNWD